MARDLTPLAVAKLKEPGTFRVRRNLYVQVGPGSAKSWLARYQYNHRPRSLGLGSFDIIPMEEAIDRTRDIRRKLRDGIDPADEKARAKVKAKVEAAKRTTFRECAKDLITSHEASWRNPKHRAQWSATLDTYAYPVLGDVAVSEIDTDLVLAVLRPIWNTKPETASRLRGRLEAVLDSARVLGKREGENPARWKGHLAKLLPARSKVRATRNHPALPYVEMPGFMKELGQREFVSARALEFAILCASRTGEVIGAQWSEIDLDAGVWTVPADRMKGKREHRVPLTSRALEILGSLPREGEWVFMGGRAGKPLSNMALLELMRGMRPGFVPHGCRSTFRDWAAEETNFPREVCEMALAHAVDNKVEAAYRRGDLFEKRRGLMQGWDTYCSGGANEPEA